ncbi:hypothetical protein [Polaromonas sp.]|uniref:hypothetical protein n=1 Tax=Polaromonas sp. TaxID=1869339 RepID=UPI0027305A2F|nr:hypothetical protein [Polaromonas sp.]MDP1740807.1 hypothetical protein [Polaromonas sp.]
MDDWLLFLVAVLLVALGLVVLWIWSMVSAAKNGKWVWFVLILIFSPLCLLYLLFADKRPPASSEPPRVRREPT